MPPEGYEEEREFAAWVDGLVEKYGRERVLTVIAEMRIWLARRAELMTNEEDGAR